jgi:hypothetical protein
MLRTVCFCVLLCSVFSLSQSVTSLGGHVTDPSGAFVPRAEITLQSDTGATRSFTTNATGNYQFQQLKPGQYSLRVSAAGFSPFTRENIELLVATPANIDVTMTISGAQQTVQVNAENVPLLNTTDASIGNAFNSRQVSSLPIEGRNVVELLSLQPGVSYIGSSTAGSTGNNDGDSRSGAVNGARSDQSNVTLDGIDVNDENKGYAFDSVLRMTQDSVGEFRVTTSNSEADAGRGSGAQVALVTKSGTNSLHGSLYEYHRDAAFVANDYFNKQTEFLNGQPNKPGKLIRNVFGGAVGGPIKKDKAFFFLNYEGQRRDESKYPERIVPTDSMRAGTLKYRASDGSTFALSPVDIKQMDPLHIGVNTAMLQLLQSYKEPNDFSVGDGLNTAGYRFTQPVNSSFNTYVARFDWNLTSKQSIFLRGNLMGDREPDVSQFPGQPVSSSGITSNKGFALGHTYVIKPQLINDFRWGLTRQGGGSAGISNQPSVGLAEIDSPVAFTRSNSFHIPVNNLVDNLSWTKGNHNLQFGTNVRFIDDWRSNTDNSFPSAGIVTGWMQPSAIAGTNTALDPGNPIYGFPAVADGSNPNVAAFNGNYDNGIMDLVGLVSQVNAVYNYNHTGKAIPLGTPVTREYRWNEYDFYAQDSWKASSDLTLTFGLHYSLLQPPTETNGNQVGPCVLSGSSCQPYSLSQFYNASFQQGLMGGAASNVPVISFGLNGSANGRAGFWNMDKADIAPRFAFAWSPHGKEGIWHSLLGGAGKTSIRGGYSLVYDHFGAGVVNTFDTQGAYGLTSQIGNAPGIQTEATAPRFQDISVIPPSLLLPAPTGGFPATPDPTAFNISWGLDSNIKTPYEHVFDFSIQRELTNSSSLEVAYVGRLAHRLMEQQDVAMPLDLRAAGTDYFAAASQLSKLAHQQVSINDIPKIPYWEQLFGPLGGVILDTDQNAPTNPTATQNVYYLFQQNLGNETNALFTLDLPDGGLGAGSSYPANRFYHNQYSALYAWRSIGQSYYHALEATYRQRFHGGIEADFNYTFSKSIDWTSQAERLGTSGGNNGAQIINSWRPDQLRGVSDFDAPHQINANWIWDLPVGRGRRFMNSGNRVLNGILGGWKLTGILRWTSGLPYAVDNGSRWPTNWDIEGFAIQDQKIPSSALKRGTGQQMFSDPTAVLNSFRPAYPGESGTRNPLRGDGYYDLDAGLDKTFRLTDAAHLQIRWETFNVTNSVRFDPHSISAQLDQSNSFGVAGSTLTQARVMQFAARIEF